VKFKLNSHNYLLFIRFGLTSLQLIRLYTNFLDFIDIVFTINCLVRDGKVLNPSLCLWYFDCFLDFYKIGLQRLTLEIIDMFLVLVAYFEHSLMLFEVGWRIKDSKLHHLSSLNDSYIWHFAFELHSSTKLKEILGLNLTNKLKLPFLSTLVLALNHDVVRNRRFFANY